MRRCGISKGEMGNKKESNQSNKDEHENGDDRQTCPPAPPLGAKARFPLLLCLTNALFAFRIDVGWWLLFTHGIFLPCPASYRIKPVYQNLRLTSKAQTRRLTAD